MGIIESTHGAKAGHPGGSLSAAEMFAYLYNKELRVDPKNPRWPDRDRFVLSKGHTAPGLYAALAYRGFFPVEDLPTLRHIGSSAVLHVGLRCRRDLLVGRDSNYGGYASPVENPIQGNVMMIDETGDAQTSAGR